MMSAGIPPGCSPVLRQDPVPYKCQLCCRSSSNPPNDMMEHHPIQRIISLKRIRESKTVDESDPRRFRSSQSSAARGNTAAPSLIRSSGSSRCRSLRPVTTCRRQEKSKQTLLLSGSIQLTRSDLNQAGFPFRLLILPSYTHVPYAIIRCKRALLFVRTFVRIP